MSTNSDEFLAGIPMPPSPMYNTHPSCSCEKVDLEVIQNAIKSQTNLIEMFDEGMKSLFESVKNIKWILHHLEYEKHRKNLKTCLDFPAPSSSIAR